MMILDSLGIAATLLALLTTLLRTTVAVRQFGFAAASVGGVALVLHLTFEGARWQMMPAYVTAFPALAMTIALLRADTMHGFARWLITILCVLPLGLSAVASVAFPVFQIPAPGGPHAVGVTAAWLRSPTSPDPYSSGPREIELQVWYPAEARSGAAERTPYWPRAIPRSHATLARAPLPWFTFTHLGLVLTHSTSDAPPLTSLGPRPVVLYSHGTGIGWASSNSVLAESLASHGYVVIGIGHTGIGSLTYLSDGSAVPFDTNTAEAMALSPPPEALELQSRLQASRNWEEQIELYALGMELMPAKALEAVGVALDTTVADQRLVLAELGVLAEGRVDTLISRPSASGLSPSEPPPWASLIDAGRAGVIGQSLGGCAAFETCRDDPRCRAGINLDGFHPRQIGEGVGAAAFLFLNRSEHLLYGTNFEASTSPVYSALVSGVTHFNFFDFAIMSPLYKRLGLLGELDGYTSLATTSAITRAFFDGHLTDKGPVDWPRDLPHVEFASANVRDTPPAQR